MVLLNTDPKNNSSLFKLFAKFDLKRMKETMISVEAIEFEKIYMVLDLRLSAGYSAFELSFLLGRRDFYVRDTENPNHSLQYSVNETNYLRQVFKCSLKKIMPGKVQPINATLKTVTTVNTTALPVYEIHKLLPSNKLIPYRTFAEEPKLVELPIKHSIAASEIQHYISFLFDGSYFNDEKTALIIFDTCQKKFGNGVRPLYVLNALKFYTSKRKAPKLATSRNEAGRMLFYKQATAQ